MIQVQKYRKNTSLHFNSNGVFKEYILRTSREEKGRKRGGR